MNTKQVPLPKIIEIIVHLRLPTPTLVQSTYIDWETSSKLIHSTALLLL